MLCVPHVTFSVALPRAPIKSARATIIALYRRALHSAPHDPLAHSHAVMLSPRTRQTLRVLPAGSCTLHVVRCGSPVAMHVARCISLPLWRTRESAAADSRSANVASSAGAAYQPVHAHQHSRTHASARAETHTRGGSTLARPLPLRRVSICAVQRMAGRGPMCLRCSD